MRGVIHTRVSTRDGRQDTENQRLQLQRFCGAQGWEIVREYLDQESGGKSEHAQFQAMMRAASTRRWDLLLFWALDRFTREDRKSVV